MCVCVCVCVCVCMCVSVYVCECVCVREREKFIFTGSFEATIMLEIIYLIPATICYHVYKSKAVFFSDRKLNFPNFLYITHT